MKKSILYIFVVLMALSLTLGAVSAEDVAEEGNAAGGDIVVTDIEDVSVADVEVDVEPLTENEYEIYWGVGVANNGPDTAYNTVVRVDGSDNLYLWDIPVISQGTYYPEYGVWDVGDLAAGDVAVMILDTVKMDEGPYWVDAIAVSDSADPDLSNNYDIAWVGLDAAAAEETLPETGNPLAMALLALLAIGVGGIKRRF
ncbi:MAG: DUF11 domain-containing protein [Methanobrevibacter millerae]|uniref:DUF11 domain-containing protein n=1 Tax=Methanobrevibacter millerae TaxID=230361 RepID=A0A8T3V9W7_9EURY|nr:hypothetical protein [Methanobrevibacter millerae]MBE6504527.1 DUF11 domain-containing protein [Methanobrevibacter millerae]